MPILSHVPMPEHGQAVPASAVFGVPDPDDRVHITRPLLAGIVSLVCDLVSVDVDQDELLVRVAAGMADRMVVVDEPGFAVYRLVKAEDAGGRQVVESQPGLAADIADEVYAAVQALAHLEQYDAAPLTALTSVPRERAADPDVRQACEDDEHGRGLELVRALSMRHGTDRGSAGKVAWAELRVTRAYACPDCGHLPGCGCDCCPYDLPAVVGAEQLSGGAR